MFSVLISFRDWSSLGVSDINAVPFIYHCVNGTQSNLASWSGIGVKIDSCSALPVSQQETTFSIPCQVELMLLLSSLHKGWGDEAQTTGETVTLLPTAAIFCADGHYNC